METRTAHWNNTEKSEKEKGYEQTKNPKWNNIKYKQMRGSVCDVKCNVNCMNCYMDNIIISGHMSAAMRNMFIINIK